MVTRSGYTGRGSTVVWQVPGNDSSTDGINFAGGVLPSATLSFTAGETVSLFLVAYAGGAAAGGPKPGLVLEFARDGVVVGRSSVELPEPDALGRVPYVASVPTASLAPGRYEVAATVRRGDAAARERAFFTVAAPAN